MSTVIYTYWQASVNNSNVKSFANANLIFTPKKISAISTIPSTVKFTYGFPSQLTPGSIAYTYGYTDTPEPLVRLPMWPTIFSHTLLLVPAFQSTRSWFGYDHQLKSSRSFPVHCMLTHSPARFLWWRRTNLFQRLTNCKRNQSRRPNLEPLFRPQRRHEGVLIRCYLQRRCR